METSFIAIVVLSLIVLTFADGEVPAGVQCVYDCLWPNATDSGEDDSYAYQSMGSYGGQSYQPEENDHCDYFEEVMTCVVGCQVEKYTIPAREHIRIYEFFAVDDQFNKEWTSETRKCPDENATTPNTTTPEEYCETLSKCLFGCALTLGKHGFCFDAVSTNVIWNQMSYAVKLEANSSLGGEFPSRCNELFVPYLPDPNQPETPCEPKPDPDEPDQHNSYQRGSYQRNSYQRNPYQRNPYQRNPYQRNAHQRNAYRRNPY